jgi:hypothetical protein
VTCVSFPPLHRLVVTEISASGPIAASAARQPAVRKKSVARPFIQRRYKLPVSQNEVSAGR